MPPKLIHCPNGTSRYQLSDTANDKHFDKLVKSFGGRYRPMLKFVFAKVRERYGTKNGELIKLAGCCDSLRPRFNATQSLKHFCRQAYKNDYSQTIKKPPPNKASKEAFVQWAKDNSVDVSDFKTRIYAGRQLISTPQIKEECVLQKSENLEKDASQALVELSKINVP
jgi:hypothetical protein